MILSDRRRPSLPPELLGRLVLVWLGLSLLLITIWASTLWHAAGGFGLSAAVAFARPLAILAGVTLLVGRIAYRLFDEEVAGLAALSCALAVPLLAQVQPLGATAAEWQTLAILFAANGLMARDCRRGGWAVGLGLAAALAISRDVLPLATAFLAVLAWKWLRNRAERWWLVNAAAALAAGSLVVLAARTALFTAPAACGGPTVAHVAAFAWIAAVSAVNAWLEPHPRAFTYAGLGLGIAGALAILAQKSAGCAAVATASPLWTLGALAAAQALGLPLLALAATTRLIAPASDWLRRWWSDYALLLAAASTAAVFDSRLGAAACALAAVPLGWQLREWSRAARTAREPRRRALVLAGMVLAVAPAAPLSLMLIAAPGEAAAQAAGGR